MLCFIMSSRIRIPEELTDMCGICGYMRLGEGPLQFDDEVVESMTDAIMHRGPDDSGKWLDREAGVALGHRRLSILDLSPLGHQPMHSANGRFIIAYNGEVYNHLDLREELEGYTFKSTSDTETILAAVSHWGLEEALSRFIGMFAIALWDREKKELSLVRDRLGIKPLYVAQAGNAFLFGSELKSLKAVPGFTPPIDRRALTLYFRHNFIPAPFSIYEGVHKVLPGEIVIVNGTGITKKRYWDVSREWRKGSENLFPGSAREATDSLETLLLDSVRRRMLSDVPLGAFLSGGIDSSVVAALMQSVASGPVKTFSIGFSEASYNEAEHAKAVAAHLGTDHTELYVTPQDLLNVVPDMPRFWDEPFADSSQIPTYILSRLTRAHVTVSLSGDGGDELFSGYERYFWTQRVQSALSRIPMPVRSAAVGAGKILPKWCYSLLGSKGQKIRWRLDALRSENYESLYHYFVSHFKKPVEFVLGGHEPATPSNTASPMDDQWAWMSLYDLLGYLPDDILTKIDRASMAVSLEARVPLLDHRVVEFAATIPTSMKVHGGQGKWLLRQVLDRYVPRDLIDRPKMGFGVPIEKWMREDLREWCGDMLNADSIRQQGYIDADAVSRMWKEYLNGESSWNYYLWDVLMFQAWLEEWE